MIGNHTGTLNDIGIRELADGDDKVLSVVVVWSSVDERFAADGDKHASVTRARRQIVLPVLFSQRVIAARCGAGAPQACLLVSYRPLAHPRTLGDRSRPRGSVRRLLGPNVVKFTRGNLLARMEHLPSARPPNPRILAQLAPGKGRPGPPVLAYWLNWHQAKAGPVVIIAGSISRAAQHYEQPPQLLRRQLSKA